MSLSRQEIEDWAAAYIEAESLPSEKKLDSPFWWAIDRFQSLFEASNAEDAWVVILEVLDRKPSQEIIGMLAAGPLEDLIEDWGPMFIDRIELESRRNPDFRHLLGGVWQSSTPEVWERIEKARGTPW